jgi:hypothetical protein
MNTVDDLRASLDRHASELPDSGAHGRAAAVRERVRVVRRRRRTASVVAAVALAVPLAGSLLAGGRHAAPEPALPAPTSTPVPGFPARLADGARLIDDVMGAQGEAELEFRVRARGVPPRWSVYCSPAGSGWFTLSLNGHKQLLAECGEAGTDAGTVSYTFDHLVRADGRPIAPGDPIDVRIRLADRKGSPALAADPGLRLGVAVYE